jgi:peptidylprolyl isomerase
MSPRLLRPIAMLTLLAALVPAGCGDDDDDAESSPPPTVADQRAALEDTSTRPEIPRPSGSPPRRLVKEDVVRGRGRPAKPGDTLTVHHAGVTFSTGKQLDSSWDGGQPYVFRLGRGRVIEGWDRGFVGMREGGRRILTIPPELAYGAQGFPPAVGPNETLVFVVDLLKIH